MIKYVIAVKMAAGEMFIRKLNCDDFWSVENPNGCTYESVYGPYESIIFECATAEEAETKAAELLKSDYKGYRLYGVKKKVNQQMEVKDMDNVFDKVGMGVEPAVVPGAKRPVVNKNTGNAITKVHFNSNTKQGMIEFKDGRTLPIYTGYKAIKMTDDHELNRIRLFLATFVNPEYTPETYGTGTWYNAEFYIGKTDRYYKIIRHDGSRQSIIAKGYSADEVIVNAFGRNPFHVVDWQNNFTKEKYKAYITYLKFKGVCDKYIKDNAVMIDTKSRAIKDLAKYFRGHLNSGKVITLPNSDCMDGFIDNFEVESVSNYIRSLNDNWEAYEFCVKVLSNVIENLGKVVYEIHEKFEYHGRSGSDVERFFGTDKKAVAKEYIETSLGVYAGELNNKLSDDYDEAHRLAKEYKDYMEVIEYK